MTHKLKCHHKPVNRNRVYDCMYIFFGKDSRMSYANSCCYSGGFMPAHLQYFPTLSQYCAFPYTEMYKQNLMVSVHTHLIAYFNIVLFYCTCILFILVTKTITFTLHYIMFLYYYFSYTNYHIMEQHHQPSAPRVVHQ